jgi:hypothetical protein
MANPRHCKYALQNTSETYLGIFCQDWSFELFIDYFVTITFIYNRQVGPISFIVNYFTYQEW